MIVVPETLEECQCHYVPPVKEFITCPDFGHSDGMNGCCHWCREMTPYQWHMCGDETWIKGLLSPGACKQQASRDEAIKFIEQYKQRQKKGGNP